MTTHFTTPLLSSLQIITESLPISSSTHVQLAAHLLNTNLSTIIPDPLNYFLHGPMILIILIFFRTEWLSPFKTLTKSFRISIKQKKLTPTTNRSLSMLIKISTLVVAATFITVLFYYIKETLSDTIQLYNKNILPVGLTLTSVALLSLYFRSKKNLSQPLLTTIKTPIKIGSLLGVVQGLALLPGISRFGTTYVAARWLGFTTRRAFQLSFLIELPIIVAGFFVKGLLPILKHPEPIAMITALGWGTIGLACVVSYFALWCAWKLAHRNIFWIFGCYLLVISGEFCFSLLAVL